jgi:chromosome segregation ATPase
MTEAERLQAEIDLAEALLRTELAQLQELEEKRRIITDGIAEIDGPSELWEHYIDEIDGSIAAARQRVEELTTLRDESLVNLQGIQ